MKFKRIKTNPVLLKSNKSRIKERLLAKFSLASSHSVGIEQQAVVGFYAKKFAIINNKVVIP